MKSISRNLWCLSTWKSEKPTSSLTSFLRYCKDMANLIFCEFWECLAISIKSYSINLSQAFMLVYMQKINFTTHFFLKILQRNSKNCFFGWFGHGWPHTLKMLGSVWRNLLRLAGQKSTSFFTFSLRYCRYCKLVVLSALDMPGYAHSKWYYRYYL